jgi:ABC-type uncharacterized transport system ATPase subunit
MSFSVNETVFLGEIDTSDKVTLKSYNKNYEVVYSKQQFLEIVKNIYKPNDFIIIDQNVYNLYKNVLNDIDSKYYYIFDAIEYRFYEEN